MVIICCDLGSKWWIKELQLYESDREMLLDDVAISDAIINAAQKLLKSQYPDFAGFQSTLLGGSLEFRPISRGWKSVQILNTGEQ